MQSDRLAKHSGFITITNKKINVRYALFKIFCGFFPTKQNPQIDPVNNSIAFKTIIIIKKEAIRLHLSEFKVMS